MTRVGRVLCPGYPRLHCDRSGPGTVMWAPQTQPVALVHHLILIPEPVLVVHDDDVIECRWFFTLLKIKKLHFAAY